MSKNIIAGRYEVLRHIGQGGMADVFLATDTYLNRRVAIKILRADLSTDSVAVLRFEREAQAATALAHPNIVEIYDVGDYKGHHYIVMEFVPGKTLKQIIKERGPLLIEEAIDIMKQLSSAVAEAHSRGIIHRDIKPQNVIVKADGSVKILDFGIAMAKGSVQLTEANNVMGSVHYLAPELAKGDHASAQSDIYALGVVLYEMLSKDVPFKADQAIQVALMHMRDTFPSIRDTFPNVPQSVENIITRATAKNPSQRYRSCDEMYRDLSTCLRQERLHEPKLILKDSQPTQNKKGKPSSNKNVSSKDSYEEAQNKNNKKKTKGFSAKKIIIGTIVGVFILAGGLFAYRHFSKSKTTVVPNLEGMTLDEAREYLTNENLVLDSEVAYELTEDTEKGIVIYVDPEIGSSITFGSSVKVTVSSGIGEKIGNYVGKNVQKVEEDLAEKYPLLKVNAVSQESSEAAGTIVRQEGLTDGSLYDPSTSGEITLYYSQYTSVYIPEDIINKDLSSATAELEALGIDVRTETLDTSSLSQDEKDEITYGVVIRCSPNAGTEYTQRKDNYVTLYYY